MTYFVPDDFEHQLVDIKGFPGYGISNDGHVWNLKLGRVVEGQVDSYGYRHVVLLKDGKRYRKSVAKLVASHYISGHLDSMQVSHSNGDRSDCHVYNLRLRGGHGMKRMEARTPPSKTRKIRLKQTGEVFLSAYSLAEYLKVDPSNVYKALKGTRKTVGGYEVEYIMT